jgi:hypothetical protein
MQEFEAVQIEEVQVTQTSYVCGIPLDYMSTRDPSILRDLIDLRKAELEGATKKAEIDAKCREVEATVNAKAREVEADAKARQSEADGKAREAEANAKVREAELNAKVQEAEWYAKIKAETPEPVFQAAVRPREETEEPAARPAKRVTTESTISYEDRVEQIVMQVWRNNQSFTGDCWTARPRNCPETVVEVMQRVYTWVRKPFNFYNVNYKLHQVKCMNVDIHLVYYNPNHDFTHLVKLFWEDLPTVVHGPVESDPLANGAHDLAQAVLGPVGRSGVQGTVYDGAPLPVADMTAVRRLDVQFRRIIMDDWAILWPPLSPNHPGVIPTFIDVNNDPIIAALQRWIVSPPNTAAPQYPVPDYAPVTMHMDHYNFGAVQYPENWKVFVRGGEDRQLAFKKGRHLIYYNAVDRALQMENPVTLAVHPERIRQFQRIMSEDGRCPVNYRVLVECLGWRSRQDARVVERLVNSVNGQPERWSLSYNMRTSLHRFLTSIRRAVAFLTYLRLGRADMEPLLSSRN